MKVDTNVLKQQGTLFYHFQRKMGVLRPFPNLNSDSPFFKVIIGLFYLEKATWIKPFD